MKIEIEYNNYKLISYNGYEKYFYAKHRVEILVNLIVILISLYLFIGTMFRPLSTILLIFSFTYLFFMWFFYYYGPISMIKRKKSSYTTKFIVTNEYFIAIGENVEIKYTWNAVKEIYLLKEYIYIFTNDNRFIVLQKSDFNNNEYEEFSQFVDTSKLNIKKL